MDLNGVGFIGAIIIGAALLNFVLGSVFHMAYSGWIAYLIIGFIGACILIAIGRLVRR